MITALLLFWSYFFHGDLSSLKFSNRYVSRLLREVSQASRVLIFIWSDSAVRQMSGISAASAAGAFL